MSISNRTLLLTLILLAGCTSFSYAAQQATSSPESSPLVEEPTVEDRVPEEAPPQPMPEAEPDPQQTARALKDLPPLKITGAPEPPQPFSGEEQAADQEVPDEIRDLVTSYNPDQFDDYCDVLVSFPQAAIRVKAIGYLSNIAETPEQKAKAVLYARAALLDPSREVRLAAVSAFQRAYSFDLAWKTDTAVGELVMMLADEEASEATLEILTAIGPAAAPSMPYLQSFLADKEYPHHDEVLKAIGAIGPAANPAAAMLLARLKEKRYDPDTAEALGKIGAEKELLELAKIPEYGFLSMAFQGIRELPNASPAAVDFTLAAAQNEELDAPTRGFAINALVKIHSSNPEIFAIVRKATRSESDFARNLAYKAISQLHPPMPEAVTLLLADYDTVEGAYTRSIIENALGVMSPLPKQRLEKLIEISVSTGGTSFFWSGRATNGREPTKAMFYPLLIEFILDKGRTPNFRIQALIALENLRTQLEGADGISEDDIIAKLKAIRKTLMADDNPREMRAMTAAILHQTQDAESSSQDPLDVQVIRLDVLPAVRTMSIFRHGINKNEIALPAMIEVLKTKNPALQETLLRALANYGEKAAAAVPTVQQIAKTAKDEDERNFANAVLQAITPNQ